LISFTPKIQREIKFVRLEDRVAVITGGGTGIGREIAQLFASEGATVVIASRKASNLEQVYKEIKSGGGKALAVPADITDDKQVQQLISRTLEEYGKIDILVNNSAASAVSSKYVADIDLDNWNDTLKVNLTGTMLCTRAVLQSMIARKSGVIINISSIAGITGHPGLSAYSTSKWGIIGFTETLAIEVGQYNIRVNALSPAATSNERFENHVRMMARDRGITFTEMMGKILTHYSLRRIAKPAEVASSALFLASDDSSAITGHNLIVSCGFHMLQPNEIP
jgi:NAD(P)-dependent dehydrogenase (short-subunit alcohol dehydrogenase family)